MLLLSCLLALSPLQMPPSPPLPPAEIQADIEIPVVDMGDFYRPESREAFIETLFNAMRKVGFFAVRNTGVDRAAIGRAYDQAKKFFKRDPAYKAESYFIALNGQRGFVPGENAKGNAAKDCKEFYHIGRELPFEELMRINIVPNVWPDQPGFKEEMVSLYRELDRYVAFLFEAIAEAINRNASEKIDLNFFNRLAEGGDSLLRALYYPALSEERLAGQSVFWAAEHTDVDLLAILPYATEKGLQVLYEGGWHTVVVPDDAFIVNVGDMLENLTNGLFVSARHRVKALEAGKERFSMVLFVHPPNEASLAPLPSCIEQTGGKAVHAEGTRKEFLWERLLELNIAPLLLEPYSKTGHTERQMKVGRASPQVVELLLKHGLASPELLESLRSSSLNF